MNHWKWIKWHISSATFPFGQLFFHSKIFELKYVSEVKKKKKIIERIEIQKDSLETAFFPPLENAMTVQSLLRIPAFHHQYLMR